MKYLVCLFVFCSLIAYGKGGKKILFIGNSFTYFNDMPQTLQKMFDESKLDFTVFQATRGGATLADHLKSNYHNDTEYLASERGQIPETIAKILSQHWDFVVLQEPQRRLLIPEIREYGFVPSVIKLDSLIRSVGGKTILFQPFPGKEYPVKYCYPGSKNVPKKYYNGGRHLINMFLLEPLPENEPIKEEFCSDSFRNSNEEFQAIARVVDDVAKKTNADIVFIGAGFQKFDAAGIPYQLFSNISHHPTQYGSYLIACMFYKYFSGRKVSPVKYTGNIEKSSATIIKEFTDSMK